MAECIGIESRPASFGLLRYLGVNDKDNNGIIEMEDEMTASWEKIEEADIDGDENLVGAEIRYYLHFLLPNADEAIKQANPYTEEDQDVLLSLYEKKSKEEESIEDLKNQAFGPSTNILAVLTLFRKKGLIEKYGINEIKSLLVEVTIATTDDPEASEFGNGHFGNISDSAYLELMDLAEKGLVEKIGISNLIELAKAAGINTGGTFHALAELGGKKLIDKIGIPRLVEIAKENGPNTYKEYEKLLKQPK